MAKNNTRRKKDIKSKLIAAICMLLVSSIMMVSSTYAWFTLSTAPEVSGITTTIGSNGNLEIALSPASGLGSDVGDANLQTGTDWGKKNLTWGNLVDMGYAGNTYGLDQLTLAPAVLALNGTNGSYTLGADTALGTPSYGSDGRISALTANAQIAGKAEGATGFGATGDKTVYGVRAVGTSSGMSAQQAKFKTSVNAISNYANAAIAAAANSLAANGNALASMLVQHAEAGDEDKNDYDIYVPDLVKLTTDLDTAITNIDEALRAAMIAAVCSIEDEILFNAVVKSLTEATDLAAMKQVFTDNDIDLPEKFTELETARNTVAGKISSAKDAAKALEKTITDVGGIKENRVEDAEGNVTITYYTDATILWSDAGDVLTALMNTSGDIKVSGYTIADIKAHMTDMNFLLNLAKDCQIQLGAGSGVYYDLAAITGNIAAKTSATVTARGMTVTLDNVIIKTTVPANTSLLPVLKTYINDNSQEDETFEPAGATSGSVLDSYYGYVIDLMVRTNAADSNLLLQTEAAQRVYDDSSNVDTMGKGTTIVFKTTKQADVASINDLVRSINIVFFDPSRGNAVFGMAKVTSVNITEVETGNFVKDDDGQDTDVKEIEYTITGSFELCKIVDSTDCAGFYEAGEVLESNTLCALTQNVPQAISALVYLDGQNVTSADVLADQNVVGALNLQFASSAELKPMENSELKNGSGSGNTPAASTPASSEPATP